MSSRKPAKIELPRKPQYLKLAADIDFFELFKKIEKRFDNCVMLESLGEESYISRHSIIGFDPEQIIWADEGCATSKIAAAARLTSRKPYYLLREIVPQNIISRKYAGGLTGYIGYDCMNYFEPSLKLQHSEMFDIFRFGVYKDGLILDKMTGEVFYFFYYADSRIELH